MHVYSGERRYLAVDLVNDGGVVAGATLSAPVLSVVTKRSETTVAGVIETTPTPPAIVGSQIRFWAQWAAVLAGRYIILAQVTLSNGEIAKARAYVVVE